MGKENVVRIASRHMTLALALAVAFLCLAQPAVAYKKLKCFMLETPEVSLPGVSQIAVLDFEGNRAVARALTDRLVMHLLESERGIGKVSKGFFSGMEEGRTHQDGAFCNVYNVVERSRLESVLSELHFSASGLVDDAQVAEIGRVLGVDAIVTGNVTVNSDEKRFKEEWTSKEKGKHVVNCLRREVNLVARMRVVSPETGEILGSTEVRAPRSDKECADALSTIESYGTLTDWAVRGAAWDLCNYMTPHFELQEFEFKKISVKEHKKLAEEAAETAEDGDLDKAFLLYNSIFEVDSYNPKLAYNIGLLHEAVGNFDSAEESYELAVSLDDDNDYQEALTRVRRQAEYAEVLSAAGVQLGGHEFLVDSGALDAALAEKIEIKGRSSDRVEVREEGKESALVVARIPGGITVTMLGREGDWYKIKLPDGKTGFVRKDDAKGN